MRQVQLSGTSSFSSRINVAAVCSPLLLFLLLALLVCYVRWSAPDQAVLVPIEISLAALGGMLFGISLSAIMLTLTRRREPVSTYEDKNVAAHQIAALEVLREEEQKRLAREMHDEFGQLLAAMKIDLSDLQQYLPKDNAKVLQRMDYIHELVNAMVTSVRRIIANLPPKVLEDLGLFNAVALLVENFEKRYKIRCDLTLPSQQAVVEQSTAAAVYRIIQEALNNVVKHAEATQVSVHIDLLDACVMLYVTDNGKGMAASALQKPGSFGLIGISERVASLNGEIKVESTLGIGASIRIMIPKAMQHAVERTT
jgi:signal transduction histidine kinase